MSFRKVHTCLINAGLGWLEFLKCHKHRQTSFSDGNLRKKNQNHGIKKLTNDYIVLPFFDTRAPKLPKAVLDIETWCQFMRCMDVISLHSSRKQKSRVLLTEIKMFVGTLSLQIPEEQGSFGVLYCWEYHAHPCHREIDQCRPGRCR